MRQLFLYKVYLFNKKLFLFFTIFAGFTLICNLTGNEVTPFYVWGMYSENEVAPKEYEIFKVTENDQLVDYSTGFLPANRFFLLSPLTYYFQIKNYEDPTRNFLQKKLNENFSLVEPYANIVLNSSNEFKEFPFWYRRYLQQTTGELVSNYRVELLKTSYDKNNLIKVNSAYILINEK
jgi:hypothetical protein